MKSQALADRLREVVLSGKLIAFTNIKEQLADVSFAEAVQKVGPLNTIAALTFHLHYYLAGVSVVLQGGDLTIKDKYSFDMKPLTTESDWHTLRKDLLSTAGLFADLVSALTDEQLAQPFVMTDYGTYERNIEAMIEHCYYHFGQIVIIKKLITVDR